MTSNEIFFWEIYIYFFSLFPDSSLLKTHINSRQVKIQAQRLKSEHLSKYDVDAKVWP